jgi:hypothetical protein
MANLYERDFQNQRPLPGARIGIREELSDLILNVDAKDTPITSMAKRGSKPGNTTFRWQVDRNPEPSVELGIVDGKDVDPNNMDGANAGLGGNTFKQYTVGFRTEVENNIHMFRRAVHVSNLTQDVLNIAGVKDELSRQLSKATIDLKRSMELTFTSDILPVLDNGTLPYRTRCLTAWIKPELASAQYNTQTKYGIQATNSAAGNYRQEIRSINENFLTPSTSIVGTGLTVDNLSENLGVRADRSVPLPRSRRRHLPQEAVHEPRVHPARSCRHQQDHEQPRRQLGHHQGFRGRVRG